LLHALVLLSVFTVKRCFYPILAPLAAVIIYQSMMLRLLVQLYAVSPDFVIKGVATWSPIGFGRRPFPVLCDV
jgi:hypothetical protein